MTIKDLVDASDGYGPYWPNVQILINGKPVDNVSCGTIAGTGQFMINLQSYDPD